MTATRHALRPYRWAELDALVEEELEIETRPTPVPAPEDPMIAEALFIEQAVLFLAAHPDPGAVLNRIESMLPQPVPDPVPAPASEAQPETEAGEPEKEPSQ